MFENLLEILTSGSTIVVSATLLSALSGASSLLAKSSNTSDEKSDENKIVEITDDLDLDSRIPEVRKALTRQESYAHKNKLSNRFLTSSQVIIGAFLASSFIQESMSNNITGFLGVLVLVSSAIHQQLRPDVEVRDANLRILELRHLLRHLEDSLFALKSGEQNAPSIITIRRWASIGLAKIEKDELSRENIVSQNENTEATKPNSP